MHMLQLARRVFIVVAVASLIAGCDGFDTGTLPSQDTDSEGTSPALSFAMENHSVTEDDETVSLTVAISASPEQEVSAEVLYANAVSGTDASDFNLPESAVVGEGNGYVAGSLTFPADAEEGATRTVELNIQDEEENEEQEDAVFVLQNVQGNATIGEPEQMTVSIGAIELFFEDFSDQELAPMTAYSVASNEDWGVSSAGDPPNAPYAVANGFGADEPSNDWLITPALNFNEYEGEVLTFLNAKGFDDTGRRGLQVKVSTDYDGSGNPENFTWTDVSDQVTFSGGDFNFVESGEVDLSGEQFQGEAVYVAFQYQSTSPDNAASWEVDNVRVVGR